MSQIWYTSEARSASVENWSEWRALLEESGFFKKRDKHIESCSGADTYHEQFSIMHKPLPLPLN